MVLRDTGIQYPCLEIVSDPQFRKVRATFFRACYPKQTTDKHVSGCRQLNHAMFFLSLEMLI